MIEWTKVAKTMKIGIPVSFRPNIQSKEDLMMNNQIVCIPIDLAICPTFEEGINKNKWMLKSIASILMTAYSFYYACLVLVRLPFNLDKLVTGFISDGLTCTYSSPIFSKKPWVYAGKESHGFFYYCPVLPKCHFSLSIGALGDDISLSVFTDTASGIDNPQELVDLFIENQKKALS